MNERERMRRVLIIAGSDSGGGAGIQADLKTCAALGVFGTTALTAITAQNTVGVQGVHELPAGFVGLQIDSVMADIGADAWKTGMLSNAEIIAVVAARARQYQAQNLVIDPVMVAKSGDPLLRPEARQALIEELVPLATVVTPNLHEARVLSGMERIETLEDQRWAAQIIYGLGPRNVVVKGGHLPGSDQSTDVLFDGHQFYEFSAPRVETRNTHGTGCTFASAIAAGLAQGYGVREAVERAKAYLHAVLERSADLRLGAGHGPLNHLVLLY